MYYAKHNGVGTANELPEGAKPISNEQYRMALTAQASGERVTVIDGNLTLYKPPVYRPDGTEAKEYTPGDPLITDAPPESLHVPEWQDGAWVEGETAEQKQAREQQEEEEYLEALPGRIAATRYEHETGGTTVDGMHVATDRQSQALITGAFSSAKDAKETGEPFSIRWKTAGGWVELDADQMISLGRAVRAHVQACFDREKELTEAVADGTFEESMLDEGWPE